MVETTTSMTEGRMDGQMQTHVHFNAMRPDLPQASIQHQASPQKGMLNQGSTPHVSSTRIARPT
eukprot:10634042-Lingulodinium_polyedra.AAC.1